MVPSSARAAADAAYETALRAARTCTHCGGSTRRTPMTLFNTCSELRGCFSQDVGERLAAAGYFCSFDCMLGSAAAAVGTAGEDYARVLRVVRATAGYAVEPAARGAQKAVHAAARAALSVRDMRMVREWDENFIGSA